MRKISLSSLLAAPFAVALAVTIQAAQAQVPAAANPGQVNQCVACHATLKGEKLATLESNFQKWFDSSHSKREVTCDKCHGGKAEIASKDKAHVGVIDIELKGKPVYYIELDKKCGECHSTEFKTYSASKHFEYQKRGSGPSCVGCHHPKSGALLAQGEIVNYCYDCHNTQDNPGSESIPKQAELTLQLMNSAQILVHWVEQDIELAKKEGKNVTGPLTRLGFARRDADLPQYWHQFDLEATQQHALKTVQAMQDIRAALLKAPLKRDQNKEAMTRSQAAGGAR